MNVPLSSNMEDYLEAIYVLEQEKGHARVKQIADALNITKPSVTAALKKLEQANLVDHPKYDLVGLTPEGSLIAQKVYRRHRVITQFLHDILKVSEETAEQDACKIEHNVSSETMERIIQFMESDNASDGGHG